MTKIPPVKKNGARWEGEIVIVNNKGTLVSNIPADDLLVYATRSKIWFKVGNYKGSIRGFSNPAEKINRWNLVAIVGESQCVEFVPGDVNVIAQYGLGLGAKVWVEIRV